MEAIEFPLLPLRRRRDGALMLSARVEEAVDVRLGRQLTVADQRKHLDARLALERGIQPASRALSCLS